MRTVYLGTSEFAVVVLERLAASDHRPQLVVTRPDRPRGRGRRLAPPPVAEAARALGIEVAQPEKVNGWEARELIAAARPDAVVVCAFGALIDEPLLSAHEMLNVHPHCCRAGARAAPIERAIEAGDEVTGVSIMRPVLEMDAGPVCLAREEAIRPDDDFGVLSRRLAELGGDLLVEALDRRPEFVDQPEEGVTIAPKVEAAERRLDPERRGAVEESAAPRPGADAARGDLGRARRSVRAARSPPRTGDLVGEGGPASAPWGSRERSARAPTAASCSPARRGSSSCARCSPRARGRCGRRTGCRGRGAEGAPRSALERCAGGSHRARPVTSTGSARRSRRGEAPRPPVAAR